MTKEQVYDSEINHLMAQIIEICKREKIAILASFDLGCGEESEDDDDRLMCTTAILGDETNPAPALLDCYRRLYQCSGSVAFVNVTNGDGKLVSSTAIVS